MTLGWGVVGTGTAGGNLITPAIAADPGSRLVGFVSRDRERATAFAEQHGAALGTAELEDLLARPDVDVVAIASPNALHPDQAIAAARAGKHVFCDKPLAATVEDAQRVLDECRAAGVRIGIDFQTRHHTAFHEARRVIASGEIGAVIAIQVDASPGAVPLGGWRTDPALAGLGATNNIAVHIHDLLRFLVDDNVVEVAAMFDVGREPVLERMPMVLMRFSRGAMAFANGNQLTPMPLNDIVIHGTEGRIDGRNITRPMKDGTMRITTAAGERSGAYSSHDAYERTVRAFREAIEEGRDPNPSGLDGLRSVELSDAIARSAREGRHVTLDA
jgi:1,5-anhydro-D-fructose reductase (1,5-anhydro-D-mannitol-forming)